MDGYQYWTEGQHLAQTSRLTVLVFALISILGCDTNETALQLQSQQLLSSHSLYCSEIQILNLEGEKALQRFPVKGPVFQIAPSDEGNEIAFTFQNKLSSDIAVLDIKSGSVKELKTTPDINEAGLTWSSHGNSWVYHSVKDKALGTAAIHEFNLAGIDEVIDTSGMAAINPHISSDGKKILYTIPSRDGSYYFNLEVLDTTTHLSKALSQLAFTTQGRWSPDGKKIAARGNKLGYGEIYVGEVSTGHWTQLTANSAEDAFPSWSADSQSIYFSSDREGSFDIYKLTVDGRSLQQLTYTKEVDEISPYILPDGKHLAYLAVRLATEKNAYSYSPSNSVDPSIQVGRYFEYCAGEIEPWKFRLAWRQKNALGMMLLGRHGELMGTTDTAVDGIEVLYLTKSERGHTLLFSGIDRSGTYATIDKDGQLYYQGQVEELTNVLREGYESWPAMDAQAAPSPLTPQQVLYPKAATWLAPIKPNEAWGIELLGDVAFYIPPINVPPRGTIIKFLRKGQSLLILRSENGMDKMIGEVDPSLVYNNYETPKVNSHEGYWNFVDLEGLPTVPPPGFIIQLGKLSNAAKVHPDGTLETPPSTIVD